MAIRNDVRAEIRQFLTTRRAKLTPENAGLPAYGGNRRVPGLRREPGRRRSCVTDAWTSWPPTSSATRCTHRRSWTRPGR